MSILRSTRIVWLCLVSAGVVSSCVDPNKDSKADAGGLQCCVVQNICDHCVCDPSVIEIGDSNNEEACETFLDNENNFGCDSSTMTGRLYRENEGLADCS